MQNLQTLRLQIDEIDNEIINLFAKRFTVIKEIGKLKKTQNIPTKDDKREEEKISMMTQIGQKKGVSNKFIIQVWNSIFSESYRLEA